jgi:hypothetical protein
MNGRGMWPGFENRIGVGTRDEFLRRYATPGWLSDRSVEFHGYRQFSLGETNGGLLRMV